MATETCCGDCCHAEQPDGDPVPGDEGPCSGCDCFLCCSSHAPITTLGAPEPAIPAGAAAEPVVTLDPAVRSADPGVDLLRPPRA